MSSTNKFWIVFGTVLTILFLVALFYALPLYSVWKQGKVGEAELARAEQNKQIQIQVAKASLESAKYLAQAEIERAKGVAEANRIIGSSLKENENYLKYLWIQSLQKENQNKTVVYVPTETQLPILEAIRNK